jgi:hypothetical protein
MTPMNRMTVPLALLALVTLAACPARDAPDPPAAAPETPAAAPAVAARPADPAMARTATCTSPELGFRVEHPADWQVNPGDVMPECSLFDPSPIRIEPGTELPFDIAVTIRHEPIEFERVVGAQMGRRELLREETEVDGRRAVRMETELTQDLLRPAGSRAYHYFVELGDRTLIAETYDLGELDYERKRRILDGMVETLRFTGGR